MSGCTSGRRVCTMPGCGKGLITTCRFVRRYRSPNCRSSFRDSAKWAVRIMSKPSSTPRGQGALTPLRHVPAAIPLRLENQYFSLDVSHPLATEMLQSGTCMFYVPGCSVSLNLNFCGTTNVNEPKRGNAASIDIDALLQNTGCRLSACATARSSAMRKGTRYGSAVLLMSSACNMS